MMEVMTGFYVVFIFRSIRLPDTNSHNPGGEGSLTPDA